MRRSLPTLAAFALVSACAMLPEGTTPEDVAAYEAAVASIGCELVGESDYLPVELQTGLSRGQVIGITEYEVQRERAVALPEGGYRLVTEACT